MAATWPSIIPMGRRRRRRPSAWATATSRVVARAWRRCRPSPPASAPRSGRGRCTRRGTRSAISTSVVADVVAQVAAAPPARCPRGRSRPSPRRPCGRDAEQDHARDAEVGQLGAPPCARDSRVCCDHARACEAIGCGLGRCPRARTAAPPGRRPTTRVSATRRRRAGCGAGGGDAAGEAHRRSA